MNDLHVWHEYVTVKISHKSLYYESHTRDVLQKLRIKSFYKNYI